MVNTFISFNFRPQRSGEVSKNHVNALHFPTICILDADIKLERMWNCFSYGQFALVSNYLSPHCLYLTYTNIIFTSETLLANVLKGNYMYFVLANSTKDDLILFKSSLVFIELVVICLETNMLVRFSQLKKEL